ncbi:MAG: hypothetical protein HC901_02800 [Bdellovibrionaceae bacterium]|nr:hypothetical protein [Pseudobdellovibrionaceae bacterium]
MFGLPGNSPDLIIQGDALLGRKLVLRYDLGKPTRFQWVHLFPARPDENVNLPGYGFPRGLTIKTREHAVHEEPAILFQNDEPLLPGNNLVCLRGSLEPVRYVDFEFSDFAQYRGVPIFPSPRSN